MTVVRLRVKLIDNYGRIASNLRISVIDSCNLSCNYCFTALSKPSMKSKLLSFKQITKLTSLFVSLGIDRIRLTGGEPLLRKNLPQLIKSLNQIEGISKINMTTNGILINKYIEQLENAKLNTINLSLDTLKEEKFKSITGKKCLAQVVENIDLIRRSKINLKINCVALKGFNDNEIIDFVEFAIDRELEVRFIEFMPFNNNNWSREKFFSSKEIFDLIQKRYSLKKLPRSHESQTSQVHEIEGNKGLIGFITSVSESFCGNCNRIRISSDGFLRPCLHNSYEINLLKLLNDDKSEDAIKKLIIDAISKKSQKHVDFLQNFTIDTKDREMIKIGG
jgi:cyclic pyranopterin phosphate synthase